MDEHAFLLTGFVCKMAPVTGGNVVNTVVPSFLIGSSSFLQVTTTIKSRMRNLALFGQIRPWTVELAALEGLEKSP